MSPLVRSNQSTSLSVEEQIKGLEGTYLSLRASRDAQKAWLWEIDHEGVAAQRRVTISRGVGEGYAIEDR